MSPLQQPFTHTLLKLGQIEPLRVEVVLPVQAYGKLRVGGKAEVMPEGLGGRHVAQITVIDQVFDSASATFGVRLELANPKGSLPAGMHCQVEFAELKGLRGKSGRAPGH